MGCTHPPTTTKEQTARLPLIFNLSLSCPACPHGVGHGASIGSRGGGGGHSRVCSGGLSLSFSQSGSPSDRGKRTQDAEDGEGLGHALRHPLPHRVPCSPAEAALRGSAAPAAGLGEGREGGTVAVPAPRPQHHLPSATYRGSSSSQGRGRSSSERSVRPTVPLKGASTNQRAREESGGSLLFADSPGTARRGPSPMWFLP